MILYTALICWICIANCEWPIILEVKLLSCVPLFATPWTVAYQAPPAMGFSRQEYWSGLPFPSPGDLPDQKHLCFLLGPGSKVAPKGPFPPRTPIPFPSSLSFSHPLPQASISSSYPPPPFLLSLSHLSFSFPSASHRLLIIPSSLPAMLSPLWSVLSIPFLSPRPFPPLSPQLHQPTHNKLATPTPELAAWSSGWAGWSGPAGGPCVHRLAAAGSTPAQVPPPRRVNSPLRHLLLVGGPVSILAAPHAGAGSRSVNKNAEYGLGGGERRGREPARQGSKE